LSEIHERNEGYPSVYRSPSTPQPLTASQRIGRAILATGMIVGALAVFIATLKELLA
jgi:hypothetical protein